MFGVKYEKEADQILVIEGTQEKLEIEGYRVAETEKAAKSLGKNIRYAALREEWNQLEDYTTDRARELEWECFHQMEGYEQGKYIEKKLKEKACKHPD